MKKILMAVILTATVFMQSSYAQTISKNKQESGNQSQYAPLLASYYNIKNALVKDNATAAAVAANSFVTAATILETKDISKSDITGLIKDADKISKSKDINKQREYFASFSTNMAAIAKAVKLTDQPVYYAYCPMKKAYWLSGEKDIKNPYYGSAMLTCGQVTETIK